MAPTNKENKVDTVSITTIANENPYQTVVNPLSESVLNLFEPSLKLIQTQLNELNQQGQLLYRTMHDENLKLSEIQHSDNDFQETFNLIETYSLKLINIKKDMKSIHERSKKLKKRALKLQQFKEKSDYFKQQGEN